MVSTWQSGQIRLNLKDKMPVRLLGCYTLFANRCPRVMWSVESMIHEDRVYDLASHELSDFVLNEMQVLAWASREWYPDE